MRALHAAGPSGQGHETVYPDIVAGMLGMATDNVTLRASDPDGPALAGIGTFGSRSLISHGGALVGRRARGHAQGAGRLRRKELEVAAADLVFRAGALSRAGHRSHRSA